RALINSRRFSTFIMRQAPLSEALKGSLHYPSYWEKDPNLWDVIDWDLFFISKFPSCTPQQSHSTLASELNVLVKALPKGRKYSKASFILNYLKRNDDRVIEFWQTQKLAKLAVNSRISEEMIKNAAKFATADEAQKLFVKSNQEKTSLASPSKREFEETESLEEIHELVEGDSDLKDSCTQDEHSAENERVPEDSDRKRKHEDDEEDIDNQALFARNLLDEAQENPLEMKNLLDAFQTYCQESENLLTNNGIMDLRPSSEFVLSYTNESDYSKLLECILNPIDGIFPEAAFNFLLEFFSKNLTCQHWYDEIEKLLDPEHDPFIKNIKRFMFEVLPIWFDAFAMGSENPIKDRNMEEEEYMTGFVHPILKKALARFANLRYRPGDKAIEASAYRKSITEQSGNADRADGIAYTSNQKPYEICVVEGSKPYDTENGKETEDFIQNARAAKDMINFLVIQEVKQKRALPTFFRTFMVQSFETSLRFYFLDYLNFYRIFEIEVCELPVDLAEMNLFPFLFRAVITWAVLVGDTDKEFQTFRNSKRSSRVSNAHNLRVLARLQHNKARPGNKKSLKMKNVI
ncbi:4090_t:CDS:10, partial [Ambispora gerdemannii]